jgi:hypothetical protein
VDGSGTRRYITGLRILQLAKTQSAPHLSLRAIRACSPQFDDLNALPVRARGFAVE